MDRPLSIVVFSKDRPAQLDLCLKSIFKNLRNLISDKWTVDVIYTSSTQNFEIGYQTLMTEWDVDPVCFNRETPIGGFEGNLERSMKEWGKNVLFFTDDDIVYKEFPINSTKAIYQALDIDDLFCVSLRLGKNTFIQDQYTNKRCPIPEEVNDGSEIIKTWLWKSHPEWSNFAYPFAVDAHIFRSSLAKKIISQVDYFNPNSLEGRINGHIRKNLDSLPNKMGCLEKGCVVNTPINRVQETCHNGAGVFFGSSAKTTNERFLRGERLSLEEMDFSTIIGVHQELRLCWEQDKCC